MSSFLTVLGYWPASPQPRDSALPTLAELVESFAAPDLSETSAILWGLAGVSGDELLPVRWLAQLDWAAVNHRVVQMRHVLGNGDNVLSNVRFADGSDVTVVIYINHNLGSLVKDAASSPARCRMWLSRCGRRTAGDDPDTTPEDVHPPLPVRGAPRRSTWGRSAPAPRRAQLPQLTDRGTCEPFSCHDPAIATAVRDDRGDSRPPRDRLEQGSRPRRRRGHCPELEEET